MPHISWLVDGPRNVVDDAGAPAVANAQSSVRRAQHLPHPVSRGRPAACFPQEARHPNAAAIRGVDKQASLRQVVRGTAVQPLAVDYRYEFIVVQLATGTIIYESHEVARYGRTDVVSEKTAKVTTLPYWV